MARALLRTALVELNATADCDIAELLTAELVANAVKHTEGDDIELVVELLPTGCQVEVHDHDPAPPCDSARPWPAAEADPWAENGRGLLLISTLSSDCGHRVTEQGKAVWFTLPGHEAREAHERRETLERREECQDRPEHQDHEEYGEPSCPGL
jgi:anti-sigma regulatory factor (Ser/Thr protein kinase)